MLRFTILFAVASVLWGVHLQPQEGLKPALLAPKKDKSDKSEKKEKKEKETPKKDKKEKEALKEKKESPKKEKKESPKKERREKEALKEEKKEKEKESPKKEKKDKEALKEEKKEKESPKKERKEKEALKEEKKEKTEKEAPKKEKKEKEAPKKEKKEKEAQKEKKENDSPKKSRTDNMKKGDVTYRMKLHNYKDMQYTTDMQVGNQTIRGILDTGSFELLVFSKWCSSCGVAKAYDPNMSSSFVEGRRTRTQTYGSGSCKSVDARDEIRIGPLRATNQAFWKADSCHMPLLDEADFNAVVGIGPPGQPLRTAHDGLTQAKKVKAIAKRLRQPISDAVYQLERESLEDLEDSGKKLSMLENFGVKKFSVCLERESGSSGWLVWNDDHQGSHFTDLPVVGEITWSVRLGGMKFQRKAKKGKKGMDSMLGCKEGCGAILDSGTSLLAVPSSIYKKAFHTLSTLDMDCSDMSRWPDLVLELGDTNLHLPPESYVGQLVGDMPNEVSKLMHLRNWGKVDQDNSANASANASLTKCEFLMMDMGEQKTQLGPMALLGMPFFREFFTTFHLGKGPGTRWVSVAPSGSGCEPTASKVVDFEATEPTRYSIRTGERRKHARQVDATTLRVPHWHQMGDVV